MVTPPRSCRSPRMAAARVWEAGCQLEVEDLLRNQRSEEELGRLLAFSLCTVAPMAEKGSHGRPVCIFVRSQGTFIWRL